MEMHWDLHWNFGWTRSGTLGWFINSHIYFVIVVNTQISIYDDYKVDMWVPWADLMK